MRTTGGRNAGPEARGRDGVKPIVIIPARMGAQRLPGKPLADINGIPMVIRCAQVAQAAAIGPVLIAAADAIIVEAAARYGIRAQLTDPALSSGTDRVAAAVESIDPAGDYDVVVNYQGDMPSLAPAAIGRCTRLFDRMPGADIATLAAISTDSAERMDESVVKAIVARPEFGAPGSDGAEAAAPGGFGPALYFTRAAAPSGPGEILHHLGIYAFRRESLRRFVAAPPSPLERRERLEQLRALELGMRIVVGFERDVARGVDTPDDLVRMRAIPGRVPHG